jgi:adenosylcobalamin-dependent ribonucleoside-triphosphate reductase
MTGFLSPGFTSAGAGSRVLDMVIEADRFPFRLPAEFLDEFRQRPVPWGFGALSWATYKRTYSRDGEEWWQTCQRVIEGMFTIYRHHCRQHHVSWEATEARELACESYRRLWEFKWTPPGRGLWIMGTRFLYERGGAALNNCGFVSTADLAEDYARPFAWMLQMSMLGVGVGFDTRGREQVSFVSPRRSDDVHRIGDSREGWKGALERLLNAYAGKGSLPRCWDYSSIRPQGSPLRSFGGFASGPEPLRQMIETLGSLHDCYIGKRADSRLIVDTMNLVGRCVVAGGIRRTAQIALGEPGDATFLSLKQDSEKLAEYRWASNNSVIAEPGMDYTGVAEKTAVNGEPGYFWLSNARAYGRIKDPPNHADEGAMGSNPCVEQTLWNKELCCLVETYPARHATLEDYLESLRIAYLYAKVVTLLETGEPETDRVMQKNRRIGCSMTGVVQAIERLGYRKFFEWCDTSYEYVRGLDEDYSKRLHMPRSIKMTSVKPSGTVSLLCGATPGTHWEHAPYYIRRMRVSANDPLTEMCRRAGYRTEPDTYAPNTTVVSFPIHVANVSRRKADVSLWEKVDLAAQMQRFWSDNQVSCTADFDPETEGTQIRHVLAAYEDRLKAIVFLPARGHGYAQAPYEEITAEQYREMIGRVSMLEGELPHSEQPESQFCEGGSCEIT